jgi:hypothetical protein
MSGFELFLQRRQAFVFFPVIEVCGLFSTVESRCMIAEMAQRVGLKVLMQQLSDDVTYFLNREAWGRLFPPVASLALETMSLSR